MAATIKHKRGTSKPSTSDVAVGELAINTTDGSLYTQNDSSKVIQISPDVINVKNYGATGDGSTDDTTAVQAALNAGVVGGKLVVFPAGVYVITDELDVAIDALLEQVHIEAQGNAILKFAPTSNKNLLHITLSNSQNHYLESAGAPRISIKGLKFAYAATTNSWGCGILINGCNIAGRHTGMSYIENCQFMPWSDATKFFSVGLRVEDFHEITISNCSFFADQATPKINTGIYFTGTSTGLSCHYYIDNCTFLYGNCGIRSTTYIEGFYVDNCGFVAATNGIYIDADSAGDEHTEPGLQVTNSHFNMGDSGNANWCIEGSALTDVLISNNLFYNGYNNPQSSDGVITRGCVKLDETTAVNIHGNVFKRIGGNTLSSFANAHYNVGVWMLDAYGSKNASIQSNIFEYFNSAKRAIWLGGASEYVTVLNNVFTECNGDIIDEGSNNTTTTAVSIADESSDTSCFPLFATAATGSLALKSGSNLTFNSSSGDLTATLLNGGAGSNLDLDFGSV